MDRSAALDGVRGLAVLLVFLSHSAGRGLAPADFLRLDGVGHIGVYLFFVLSSWLLTGLVLREIETTGTLRFRRFYLRRFFRIAPLYWGVVTVVFGLQITRGVLTPEYLHVDGGWPGFVRHLLFLRGDSLFWTIPCEVSFYVVLPLLAWLLARKPLPALVLIGVAAIAFSAWTALHYQRPPLTLPVARFVAIAHKSQFIEVFLIPMLGAWLLARHGDTLRRHLNHRAWLEGLTAFALAAFLFYVFAVTCRQFLWFERSDYLFRFQSWIFALVFTWLLGVIELVPEGRLARALGNRLLRLMGVLGFSWYLLHFPVFQGMHLQREVLDVSFPGVDLAWFIATWCACAAVSAVSFQLIEKPGMALGRRFEGRRRA